MTQDGWAARYTRVIAGEIRRYRQQRGFSAQQVSDACAKAGLEISRSTLADLENGRRENITVTELLMLAAVLDVPPVQLMLPVLRDEETVEILPGYSVAVWDAALWIRGDGVLRRDLDGRVNAVQSAGSRHGYRHVTAMSLLHDYKTEVIRFYEHVRTLELAADKPAPAKPAQRDGYDRYLKMQQSLVESAARRIARLRVIMIDRGLAPPPLDPRLAQVIGEDAPPPAA